MISSAGRIASSYSRLKHARGLSPHLEAGVSFHGGFGSAAANLVRVRVGVGGVARVRVRVKVGVKVRVKVGVKVGAPRPT